VEIYTTYRLVSWYDFLRQCEAVFEVPRADFDGRSRNWTMKEFPGNTIVLYEAGHVDIEIQYLQTRQWSYEHRGVAGVGLTFDSAFETYSSWFDGTVNWFHLS